MMMPLHNEVPKQSPIATRSPLKRFLPRQKLQKIAVFAMLAVATLACNIFGPGFGSDSGPIVIHRQLPTLTPTVLLALAATPAMTTAADSAGGVLAPIDSSIESDAARALSLLDTYPTPSTAAVETEQPTAPNDSATGAVPSQPVEANPAQPQPVEAVAAAPTAPTAPPPNSQSIDDSAGEPLPSTELPAPVEAASAAPTEEPLPTETPAPTPLPEGWVFNGVQLTPKPDGSALLVHGNLLNNSGTPQNLAAVTGTFYDEQGQAIGDGNLTDYWPVAAVPPGGQVPFELVAPGLQSAADYDLQVEAEPGELVLRQDFEFIEVNPAPKEGKYCVSGKVRNPGGELQSYLVIATVLYDAEGNVINYYDKLEQSIGNLKDDQTLDFEICVDPLNEEVARFEPQAWGL